MTYISQEMLKKFVINTCYEDIEHSLVASKKHLPWIFLIYVENCVGWKSIFYYILKQKMEKLLFLK